MSSEISREEIGKRIAFLRKRKGFSQDDLSKLIAISRSSLVQIEAGKRNLDVLELQKLASILEFTMNEFMSTEFMLEKKHLLNDFVNVLESEERISVTTTNVPKLKAVLLYLLEKCAGKPNVGETVLYKLLYFADFNYYELYEEHLTGSRYRKLPFGPVPQNLDTIIDEMIVSHSIQRIKTEFHGLPQKRYIPLEKSNLKLINGAEKEVLDKVIEQFSDWTASAISAYSHKDLPWIVSKEGEEINYELAFYREAPFSVRTYDDENLES